MTDFRMPSYIYRRGAAGAPPRPSQTIPCVPHTVRHAHAHAHVHVHAHAHVHAHVHVVHVQHVHVHVCMCASACVHVCAVRLAPLDVVAGRPVVP